MDLLKGRFKILALVASLISFYLIAEDNNDEDKNDVYQEQELKELIRVESDRALPRDI